MVKAWLVVAAAAAVAAGGQRKPSPLVGPVEYLWPMGAPGAVGEEPADKPSLTLYLAAAEKAVGVAVVVCPGGGYGTLAVGHEGHDIGVWLNGLGVHAFILRYRHAPRYRHPHPMLDAQRAIRTVRARAKEWTVDPNRIGIWGFSAGGHLASTAATHFDDGKADADDPIDRVSCRPDFAILTYPVIVLGKPYTHKGSQRNLLGDKADDPLMVEELSNERKVTEKCPPAFLVHTTNDTVVPPENSIDFYLACRKAKVPAELHIYEKGPHGFGLAPKDPVLGTWPGQLAAWLGARGFLKK